MKNFIQWKGVDICMDFWCDCGKQTHFDGWCAYNIQCPECKQIYKLPESIEITKVDEPTHKPLTAVE